MFNVAYLLLSKCYGTKGIHACISLDILEQGHCEVDQEINFLSRFLVWAVTSQSLRDGLASFFPSGMSTQRTEMSPKVAGYVGKNGSRNVT